MLREGKVGCGDAGTFTWLICNLINLMLGCVTVAQDSEITFEDCVRFCSPCYRKDVVKLE